MYCGRKGQKAGPVGYVPWWVARLRVAEKWPVYPGVNWSKAIWERRALLLLEAESHSYDFEPKTKK